MHHCWMTQSYWEAYSDSVERRCRNAQPVFWYKFLNRQKVGLYVSFNCHKQVRPPKCDLYVVLLSVFYGALLDISMSKCYPSGES